MTLPTTIKIIYRNVLFEMFVMNLCNKTVLITGAARGLGAAIAIKLAARGAKLALVDLDKTKLEPMH